jgi:hypothetical protein
LNGKFKAMDLSLVLISLREWAGNS